MAALLESLSEYFSTINFDTLIADFQVIFEGIDFDLVVETFKSVYETIAALFA